MKEFYEMLAWFHGTMSNTSAQGAHGYSYQLSQLQQLSQENNAFPERFVQMNKFKQDAIIQNFTEQDN